MKEEMDHIAELQKRLYARNPDSIPKRKFGILRPLNQNVSSTWGKTEVEDKDVERKSGISGIKRFFLFSTFFFLLALGLLLFSVFKGASVLSSKNVDLTIVGNTFIPGGEELPLQVEIVNKNSADLLDATLILNYPRGAVDSVEGDTLRVERKLGTIGGGKNKTEKFAVVLHGEQGAVRPITAQLQYALEGSSSLFQKETDFSVLINSNPLTLTLDAPYAIAANQPLTMTLRSRFKGDQLLPNVRVRVDYPNGFVFQSAVPEPISGNNIWTLGDLQNGDEQVIAIRGRIVGQDGDEKAFRVSVGTPENDLENRISVTYNSTIHTVVLSQPFIASDIYINSETSDVVAVPIGQKVSGNITWRNMSGKRVVNPTFSLALSGDSVNYGTAVAENGYFDASTRTLIWNTQSNPDLATIEPGAQGQLSFSFDSNSARAENDSVLTLSVKGAFPEDGFVEESIAAIDETRVRYSAHIQFAVQSLYSAGLIKNTGPFPPKVNQDTTYSIVWTARPSENALSEYQVSALLPMGVVWNGVHSPQSERIIYNPETRMVVWNLGVLPKAGAIPQTRSVTFQVQVKPTTEQVGLELPLLGVTSINAVDTAANVPIRVTRPEVSTRLVTDPAFVSGYEKVLP